MRSSTITLFTVALFATLSNCALAQQTPAPEQKRSVLIVGGIAHLGTGDKINDSAIGFRNGKIDFVGRKFQCDRSRYDDIIDATGMHIYPGFIASNSTLGLQEIGAVRASRDQWEVGTFRPNVAQSSPSIPTLRLLQLFVPTVSSWAKSLRAVE